MTLANDIKIFSCQEPQHLIDILSSEEDELMWDQWEVIRKIIQHERFPINTEAQQEVGGAILFQEWEQPPIQCTDLTTTGDLVIIDFYMASLSFNSEYCFI